MLSSGTLVARAKLVLATLALGLLFVGIPGEALGAWVRDTVRVNVRTGPGTKFRIVETLKSGDRLRELSNNPGADWIEVRLPNGTEGWVPKGYLVKAAPASVRLPQLEEQLQQAREQVEELAEKLHQQSAAILELETLRERNETLEVENVQVAGASRWKSMGMGAAIVVCGMVLGMGILTFSGRLPAARGRRIKL